MYRKITAAIATTIMITAMFASFATVSGSHSHRAVWEDTGTNKIKLKGGVSRVFSINVRNSGPDPIENVRIVTPELTPNTVVKMTKDNVMETVSDNNVILPAGTYVQLTASENFLLVENTEILRENGTWVDIPATTDNAYLRENGLMEVIYNTGAGLTGQDNVSPIKDVGITLTTDNRLRLLEDTLVILKGDNTVELPENTPFEVVNTDNAENLDTGDNLKVRSGTVLNLENNSGTTRSENERLRTTEDIEVKRNGVWVDTISAGTTVELRVHDNVLATNNTVLQVDNPTAVTLPENTDIIRERGKEMLIENVPENQPVGWTQDNGTSTTPSDSYVEWTTNENYDVEDGKSLDFPMSLDVPTAGGEYSVYVRTTDSKGTTKQSMLILEVDNVAPTVNVEASPELASENMEISITITASETLAKLENVMVAENNAPENTQVTVTPNADNTVWTGTYMTGDNVERDGTATVYVKEYEDSVGNAGGENTDTFEIDRKNPQTPQLVAPEIKGWPTDALTGSPATKETDIADWFVEGTAYDNGGAVLAAGTVEIRIGATVLTATADSDGYWYENELSLSEGTQEVGVTYVDEAGNESAENVENITLDTTAPSISIASPEDGALTTDNTPAIELTISDATVGIENDAFEADNSGFEVKLRDADNNVLATLTAVAPPTSDPFNSFTFENQWPTDNALSDNSYNVFAQAGDNFLATSAYSTFTIDTTVPTFTESDLADTSTLKRSDGTLISSDTRAVDEKTLTMTGVAVEAGSTIKIYNQNDTLLGDVTLDEGKEDWKATINLEDCYNDIYVEETDRAGNTSDKVFFRGIVADEDPPEIKLSSETAALADTETGDSSVKVKATITDTCADYKDLDVSLRSPQYDVPEGYATLSPDGTIQVTVPLREGNNKIDIVAKDQVRNTTVESFIIKRTVTPWAVYAAIAAIIAIILAAIAVIRIERS